MWQIERGAKHNVSAEKLDRLAVALGWPSIRALYDSDAADPPTPADHQSDDLVEQVAERVLERLRALSRPDPFIRPIVVQELSATVSAGGGSGSDAQAWRERVRDDERELWATRVSGECMEPEIPLGSWVIFDPHARAQDGDVVVATLDDGRHLCKRYFQRDGHVELLPDNPDEAHQAVRVDRRQLGNGVQIEGVVIQVSKPVERRRKKG